MKYQTKISSKFQEQKLKKGVFNEGEDKEDVLGLWGMSMDYYAQFLLKQGRKPEALSQFQVRPKRPK